MTKSRAAVVEERDAAFSYRDIEIDEPGPGEILVRVVATGVCHTDEITRHGDMPMPVPAVLGHEGAGVVEAVGDDVTSPAVGDRVVLGWPFCGQCEHCKDGEHRYCARLGEAVAGGFRLLGPRAGQSAYRTADGSPLHGHFFGQSSFATYSLALASSAVSVPDDIPLDIAGPLACGISTGAGAVLNTARPGCGDSVVVYGAGAVGLAAVMAATNTPATTIVAVDKHPSRLQLARELGATHVVDAAVEPDVVETVRDLCGGPADFALECTGVIAVVEQAVATVGMLGTCLLVGGAPAGASFEVDHLTTMWGKRIVGVLGGGGRSDRLVPTLFALYRQGRFPFDRLISYFDFDDVERALESSHRGEAIKPVLRVRPEEGGPAEPVPEADTGVVGIA
ncbi:NAD(P)-dependent alcohol dehydrogenase [Georgenia halophila]|uniref:NAD(P)-dependent alcohol dehydrogenase n=1 Tax=Georgenia halophila TaxID=620889 RepID=A0ABP8L1K5_9MICO